MDIECSLRLANNNAQQDAEDGVIQSQASTVKFIIS